MVRQDSPHALTVDSPVTDCAFGFVKHLSLKEVPGHVFHPGSLKLDQYGHMESDCE